MSQISSLSSLRRRVSIFSALALLIVAFSVIRICLSYRQMSMTADEPSHIAPGMQMLDKGQFTYEVHHPPLARMATALLPYLDGDRSHGDSSFWSEGVDLYEGQGTYWRTLTLSRLGILPFYIIGVFLLWSWTKKLFGEQTALFAVLCYTLIPAVLAHAGLSTTDAACAAGVLASSYALWWWLQKPDWSRTLVLGLAAGLAAASKMSFLTFFPVSATAIIIHEYFSRRRNGTSLNISFPRIAGYSVTVFLLAFFVLWASYGFDYGPIPATDPDYSYQPDPNATGLKVPAPMYFAGISAVLDENKLGHARYFMGSPRLDHGSPLFFPVAIAVKTPLAILLLFALGAVALFYRNDRAYKSKSLTDYLAKKEALPLIVSAAMLVSVLPSNINVGVRHILPIFPFVAMLAAIGASWLWSRYGRNGRVALGLLILWMFVSSMSSGSDHLSYFNELASASSAAPVLLDSDIDWGQDLDKLVDTLNARGIQRFDFVYFGHANFYRRGLKNALGLNKDESPNTEWVAISKMFLYVYDQYAWLRKETPTVRIGNTILLYRFSNEDIARIHAEISGSSAPPPAPTVDVAGAEAIAAASPTPANYLDLSLAYYQAQRFNDCITAARKAIAIKPDYAAAYNNICTAYNKLSQWDAAIAAGKQAVRLDSSNQLAKNNLTYAIGEKNKLSKSTP